MNESGVNSTFTMNESVLPEPDFNTSEPPADATLERAARNPEDSFAAQSSPTNGWHYKYQSSHRAPNFYGVGLSGFGTWYNAIRIDLPQGEVPEMTYAGFDSSIEAQGFLHKDNSGSPGEVVGTTEVISPGSNQNFLDFPDDPAIDGGTYWAILYMQDPGVNVFPMGTYKPYASDGGWTSVNGNTWSNSALQQFDMTLSTEVKVREETGDPLQNFEITQTDNALAPGDIMDFAVTNVEGDLESVNWAFGDGGTASGESVSHTYNNEGEYTIEATASGAGNSVTRTTNVTVTSEFDIAYAPKNPEAGDRITFEAINYDPEADLVWSFNDGETATGPTVSHRYVQKGEYNVSVTDTGGALSNEVGDSAFKIVEVDEGDLIVDSIFLNGLDGTLIDGLQDEVEVEMFIATADIQEFESVEINVEGVVSSLQPTNNNGSVRTWEGTVDLSHISSDTEAEIVLTEPSGDEVTETRQIEVIEPRWVDVLFDFFDPVLDETPADVTLSYSPFNDELVLAESGGPWLPDIKVSADAEGRLSYDGEELGFGAGGNFELRIADVAGRITLDSDVTFDSNLDVSELDIEVGLEVERWFLDEEYSLDDLVRGDDTVPNRIADLTPTCGVSVEASVVGSGALNYVLVDGLNPLENSDSFAFFIGPSTPLEGGAGCGPVSANLSTEPQALFGAELLEPRGAGIEIDFSSVDASIEADLGWFGSIDYEGSLNLASFSGSFGASPFTLGDHGYPDLVRSQRSVQKPSVSPQSDEVGWAELATPEPARQPTPLADVSAVTADGTGVADVLAPTTGADSVFRLTERPFDDTDPALADAPDSDEQYLLWSSEPESTGNAEPSKLRLRTGSGQAWNDPIEVTNGTDHAAAPTLATSDNGALAAWAAQNGSTTLAETDNPFAEYELAVASASDPADPAAWSDPVKLTDGAAYETSPVVAPLDGDRWLVAWDRNTEANLSNVDAEAVGYAVLSTAGGKLTIEAQETIADARSPAVMTEGPGDDDATLAFHRPDAGNTDGEVVQAGVDADTGELSVETTHSVTGFPELTAADDTLVWADGPANAPALTSADERGATEAIPVNESITGLEDLELAASGDRNVLTYTAGVRGVDITDSPLFAQVGIGDSWGETRQLVRSDLADGANSVGGQAALATDDGVSVAFVATGADTSDDLFLAEQSADPIYALDTTVDAPEPAVGDGVTVTATVENVGVDDGTEAVDVALLDDDTVLDSASVGPLAGDEAETVDLTASVPSSGDLVVSVDGVAPEDDGGLVSQSERLELVTGAVEVVGVAAVERPDETTLEADVTVANAEGGADSEPLTLTLVDGGEHITTESVPSLAAGESTVVSLSFDPDVLETDISERFVLDAADGSRSPDVENRRTSLWVGQSDLHVVDVVQYQEASDGTIVASVLMANSGPLGTPATVVAVNESNSTGETVGTATVTVPPALNGTTEFVQVHVPLGNLTEGTEVRLDAEPARFDRDYGTTALWTEAGPVVGTFDLKPVVEDPPLDLTGDGLYEDVDGNGAFERGDVTALFGNLDTEPVRTQAWALGFAGGEQREQVGIVDVQALRDRLETGDDAPDDITPVDNATVTLQPSSPTVPVGSETTLDVVVEGASEGLAALDFDVGDDNRLHRAGRHGVQQLRTHR